MKRRTNRRRHEQRVRKCLVVDVAPILKDIERVLPTVKTRRRREAIEEVRHFLLSVRLPQGSGWDTAPPPRGPQCPPLSKFLEALETLRVCGVLDRLPLALLKQRAAALAAARKAGGIKP